MRLWPCSHPFDSLTVQEPLKTDKQDEDFMGHVLLLRCGKCSKELGLKWSELVGGVDGFLSRGKPKADLGDRLIASIAAEVHRTQPPADERLARLEAKIADLESANRRNHGAFASGAFGPL